MGTFQASVLARAGVGFLRIVDRDYVELNNLQRQWLFDEADAEQGLPKAVAAANHLRRVNSTIVVDPVVADLTSENAEELLQGAAVVLDGADNFETRYLLNDWAVKNRIPWIYGAAVSSYGIVMTIQPAVTACFACVYPEPPSGAQPTCETAGVLNTIPSAIAALQTSAALQILSGHEGEVPRTITTVDVWTGAIRQIAQPPRDPDCRACGKKQFDYLDGRHRKPISLCGRNAVQIHERARPIDLAKLAEQLAPVGRVKANEFALRFFEGPYEMTVFPDGRAIIKGTTDVGLARSFYARFIGA